MCLLYRAARAPFLRTSSDVFFMQQLALRGNVLEAEKIVVFCRNVSGL